MESDAFCQTFCGLMGSMKCYIYMLSFLCKSSHSFGASCIITPWRKWQTKYLDVCTTSTALCRWPMASQGNKKSRVKWQRCTERYVVNDIALRNMSVPGKCGGKVNVPHTWTDKLNACFESKPVSGRKYFRFCICVCRCASHVSSGYEPQFVFQMHASFVSILVPMYVSHESAAAAINPKSLPPQQQQQRRKYEQSRPLARRYEQPQPQPQPPQPQTVWPGWLVRITRPWDMSTKIASAIFYFPMHVSCESYGPEACFLWVLCCFNLMSLMLLSLMLLPIFGVWLLWDS